MESHSESFKIRVAQKLHAYNLFILVGLIAHGLLQYLSIHDHTMVWGGFGTWLRTIRPNTLPSEMVVALTMTRAYEEFLLDEQDASTFKKFLREKTAFRQMRYHIPSMAEAA